MKNSKKASSVKTTKTKKTKQAKIKTKTTKTTIKKDKAITKKKVVSKVDKKEEYISEGLSNLIEDSTINSLPDGPLKNKYKELDGVMEEIEKVRDEHDPDMSSYLNNLVEEASRIREEIKDLKAKM